LTINNIREYTVNVIQDTATAKCYFLNVFKTKSLITQENNATSDLVPCNFTNQV
jgi:hypothetical protein